MNNQAQIYDENAPKHPTKLNINGDLLQKSRALNIDLSATLETALKDLLLENAAQKWSTANKLAIREYNEFVETHGYFAEELKDF